MENPSGAVIVPNGRGSSGRSRDWYTSVSSADLAQTRCARDHDLLGERFDAFAIARSLDMHPRDEAQCSGRGSHPGRGRTPARFRPGLGHRSTLIGKRVANKQVVVRSSSSHRWTITRVAACLIGCPITSQAKGYVFEVPIPAGSGVTGVVLADHVKSFDWRARGAERITIVPDDVVQDAARIVAALIGLEP